MPTRPGHALRLRRAARARSKSPSRIVDDHRVRHALLADEAGQRARVDAGDADDAARLQPGVEVARGAVVRRLGDVGLDDAAAHAGGRRHVDRLDVLVVDADVADVREGEGDDLPGVGGVGQDLLIAGHRRVEADLADGLAGRADAVTLDRGAVGEHEERGRLGVGPALGIPVAHGGVDSARRGMLRGAAPKVPLHRQALVDPRLDVGHDPFLADVV